uniref:Uncharacterized protein At2g12050 n=1 Tax=Arabidopsis thaliana TaxID=3702 RepID=Q9ZUR5_ARATH|nr:hypothetical protein [Arabidopsis thaliana]AAM15359.1 hypothetical protein [Arabidopsis thaliana]
MVKKERHKVVGVREEDVKRMLRLIMPYLNESLHQQLRALFSGDPSTTLKITNYWKELEEMKHMTKQEFIASFRSSGFSTGAYIPMCAKIIKKDFGKHGLAVLPGIKIITLETLVSKSSKLGLKDKLIIIIVVIVKLVMP